MYTILTPDKHLLFLNAYHISGKCLLPLGFVSSLWFFKGNSFNVNEKIQKTTHTLTLLNVGYHSYVSTSCVISDYIKHSKIETFARLTNIKSHSVASLGFLYFIWKNKSTQFLEIKKDST